MMPPHSMCVSPGIKCTAAGFFVEFHLYVFLMHQLRALFRTGGLHEVAQFKPQQDHRQLAPSILRPCYMHSYLYFEI